MTRFRSAAVAATIAAGILSVVPSATAQTPARHSPPGGLGATSVVTSPGVLDVLLGAGIVPSPAGSASVGLAYAKNKVLERFRFPISSSTADLKKGTGDVFHSGGITLTKKHTELEVGNFDINLKTGKVYANQVNHAKAHLPLLDLDLKGLKVTAGKGATVLSGITATLDGQAAKAINATFGTALPTNGSLSFATASVYLN